MFVYFIHDNIVTLYGFIINNSQNKSCISNIQPKYNFIYFDFITYCYYQVLKLGV